MKHHQKHIPVLAISLVLIALALFYNELSKLRNNTSTDDPITVTSLNKPRPKIVDYQVHEGDTLSSIAQQYNVSPETIMWANSLTSDNIQSGTTLRILPVSGVAHIVSPGETVESIAAQYSTDPQNIISFPFNEYQNYKTFELVPGETIIVPYGVMR